MSEGVGWKPGHFVNKGFSTVGSTGNAGIANDSSSSEGGWKPGHFIKKISKVGGDGGDGKGDENEEEEPNFTEVPVSASDTDAFPPPMTAEAGVLDGASLGQSDLSMLMTNNEAFFINVVVIDSSAAVNSQVTEKLGSGFWGKSAAALAKSVVTESKIASKVAAELVEKIPATVASMGITMECVPKFQFGSYIVLRALVKEVTPVQLMQFAKGDKFATSFSNMMDAFQAMGLADAIDQAVAKVLDKVNTAILTKLEESLPLKLQEQGIVTTVVCKAASQQAEFFFDFIAGAKGTPGGSSSGAP